MWTFPAKATWILQSPHVRALFAYWLNRYGVNSFESWYRSHIHGHILHRHRVVVKSQSNFSSLSHSRSMQTVAQRTATSSTVHFLGSQNVHCSWCIYDMVQQIAWWWLLPVETCRYMHNLTVINRCVWLKLYILSNLM